MKHLKLLCLNLALFSFMFHAEIAIALSKQIETKFESMSIAQLETLNPKNSEETGYVSFLIGRAYLLGVHTNLSHIQINFEKAVQWFRKARQAHYESAEFMLGMALFYQSGVLIEKQEYKQAYDLLMEAVHYKANSKELYGRITHRLATLYKMGLGVKKDPTKVYEWLQRSANVGYPVSMYLMGVSYRDKYVQSRKREDFSKSIYWLTLAATATEQVADAYAQLASLYLSYKQFYDASTGFYYALAGVEHGSAKSARIVAYCYETGTWVQKSNELALEYYRKAIELKLDAEEAVEVKRKIKELCLNCDV